MNNRKFIFLAGLHRSGTSLLHEIIREHPEISGFSGTGVPEDEGQHLQSVYAPAKTYGGPGKFVFDSRSYMDESHLLATSESANKIFEQWSSYYDLSCEYLVEKSPPNIIRTRFLQKLFPDSKFIVILRHPLAVAYATKKWSRSSISSLFEHSVLAYEIFLKDMKALDFVYVLRYENFVFEPQKVIDNICSYLGIESVEVSHTVRSNVNEKYFSMWEDDRRKVQGHILKELPQEIEIQVNKCGYSLVNYNSLVPVLWLGENKRRTE